jgi:hypothetical protein
MATNHPTASVTGRQGWDWSEQYADAATEGTSQDPSNQEQSASQPSYRELQQQVSHLEGQLEQKDRQLQYVIDHYERLLTEKNRKLRRRDTPSEHESRPAGLVDLVREVTDR